MSTEPIAIAPKAKYRQTTGGKTVSSAKAGNGKMARNAGKVSWKAGTGMGKK